MKRQSLVLLCLLVGLAFWGGASPVQAIEANCSTQTVIPSEECEALEALYNATAGASWTNYTHWLDYSDPCTWFGVTCTGATVTALSLDHNNLVGTIPPEFGSLSNLQYAVLNNNQLSGNLPAELGNLSALQYLYLEYNQLNGSIPAELGDLTNLKVLWLESNQLDGSIPAELGNLSNLTHLVISINLLTGNIPIEIGSLTNLEYLYLANNQLSGSIPATLGSLSNIIDLNLNNNQLSGSIPAELGNLSTMWFLRLANNQLDGSIPAELGGLSHLYSLLLDHNQLSGSIPAELSSLSSLLRIYLNSNELTGTIPAELGSLGNLIYLSMDDNLLSGSIPMSFTQLTALETFYFHDTSLCEPTDASYQTWKAGVSDYSGASTCPVLYVRSSGVYDGDVTENSETANVGGSYNRTATTLMVGDTAIDQQIKGILHFNTADLPNSAVINKVSLRVKIESIGGTTPFDSHGFLIVDVDKPYFGTLVGLQTLDFEDTPDMKVACTLARTASGWYLCSLKADAFAYVNKYGFTQFRLRFQLGDNDNGIADTLNFYSGDYSTADARPILFVEYYVP